MNKLTILLFFLNGFFNAAHASLAVGQSTADFTQDPEYTFNAINHSVISETVAPIGPSPGDTFILDGYGTLDSSSSFASFTYSYNIAGRFVSATPDGKLFFEHGIEMEGVSNQLNLYMGIAIASPEADENNAASYTSGYHVLTMEVLPLAGETGFLDPGSFRGEDQITFKLIDGDKEKFGIVDNDLMLKLSTEIMLADFSNGFPPQAFNFGAFNPACGSLDNPFDSCSREMGNARFTMAHAPIPSAFGLFLTGFGLLSWAAKRNRIA